MSSSQMFVNASDFKVDCLKFNTPRVNASGGKNVGITNSVTKKGLAIATPLMLTWGLSEYTSEVNGRTTYDISLQFPSENYPNEEASDFLEKLQQLEELCKETATKKASEWFNKPSMSPEVVDALWTPMLRYKKGSGGMPDTSTAPSLRVKVPYYDEQFKIELYDTEGKMLFPGGDLEPKDLLPKLTNVALIIQSGGVWFANGKFGTTWKLVQGVVKPRASLFGQCHIKLNSDQKETLNKQEDTNSTNNDEFDATVVEDSDDEESAEVVTHAQAEKSRSPSPKAASPEPPVEKPKAVKKKRVVKKLGD